jgi:hypothetical protein
MGNAAVRLRNAAAYYNVGGSGSTAGFVSVAVVVFLLLVLFWVSFALADSAVLFKDLMEAGRVESKQLSHACFCTLLFLSYVVFLPFPFNSLFARGKKMHCCRIRKAARLPSSTYSYWKM